MTVDIKDMTIFDAMNARSKKEHQTRRARDSSPFAQQGHQTSARCHCGKSAKDFFQRGVLHVAAEHELVRHQFHQTGVDEDAGRDGVEDAVDDECRLRARCE